MSQMYITNVTSVFCNADVKIWLNKKCEKENFIHLHVFNLSLDLLLQHQCFIDVIDVLDNTYCIMIICSFFRSTQCIHNDNV